MACEGFKDEKENAAVDNAKYFSKCEPAEAKAFKADDNKKIILNSGYTVVTATPTKVYCESGYYFSSTD